MGVVTAVDCAESWAIWQKDVIITVISLSCDNILSRHVPVYFCWMDMTLGLFEKRIMYLKYNAGNVSTKE